MKPPCMVVVRYVLPALRSVIMKDLMERHKMRKIEVSRKMGLTPAAITQYLQGKRGAAFAEEILQSEEIMSIAADIAEMMTRSETSTEELVEKLCTACSLIKSSGLVCHLHKENLPSLKTCTICGQTS